VCSNNDWIWDSSVPPATRRLSPDHVAKLHLRSLQPAGMALIWEGFITKFGPVTRASRPGQLHLRRVKGNSEAGQPSYATSTTTTSARLLQHLRLPLGPTPATASSSTGTFSCRWTSPSASTHLESALALDVLAPAGASTRRPLASRLRHGHRAVLRQQRSSATTGFFLEPRGNRRAPTTSTRSTSHHQGVPDQDFSIELIAASSTS